MNDKLWKEKTNKKLHLFHYKKENSRPEFYIEQDISGNSFTEYFSYKINGINANDYIAFRLTHPDNKIYLVGTILKHYRFKGNNWLEPHTVMEFSGTFLYGSITSKLHEIIHNKVGVDGPPKMKTIVDPDLIYNFAKLITEWHMGLHRD